MKIELKQGQLVDLFIEKMKQDEFCVKHTNGTYDKADPTHFEEVTARVFLEHGYSVFTDHVDEPPYETDYPQPEIVEVHIKDVTWGVEFEFDTSLGIEKGYYQRPTSGTEDGDWHRVTENFKRIFGDIFLCGESPDYYEIDEETGEFERSWR